MSNQTSDNNKNSEEYIASLFSNIGIVVYEMKCKHSVKAVLCA